MTPAGKPQRSQCRALKDLVGTYDVTDLAPWEVKGSADRFSYLTSAGSLLNSGGLRHKKRYALFGLQTSESVGLSTSTLAEAWVYIVAS